MAVQNEPINIKSYDDSFLFVPTAGMRLAPEILTLELFRELFFDSFSGDSKEVKLDPNSSDSYNLNERGVLYATRGRKRVSRKSQNDGLSFYAPAYPSLARYAWLRRRSDRVVRDFLFRGPLSQYYNGFPQGKAVDKQPALNCILSALRGNNTATENEYRGKEFLSVAIKDIEFDFDEQAAELRLLSYLQDEKFVFYHSHADPLAETIYRDFINICNLECHLSRLHWLLILQTFLRIALSSWLLSHMKLTSIISDFSFSVLENNPIPSEEDIVFEVSRRNLSLFRPSDTPTLEIKSHVIEYMQSRIELKLLLVALDEVSTEFSHDTPLSFTRRGANLCSLEELLLLFRKNSHKLSNYFSASTQDDIRRRLVRFSERYSGWKDPLKKGQGKNYDEYLRVLRRNESHDFDDGYLLTPYKTHGNRKAFKVSPGPQLLQVFTFLASSRKKQEDNMGLFMLSDLEEHFSLYGIDFSSFSGSRSRLIDKLQEIGLLKGSPDAGDSAEILNPYMLQT